MLWASCAVGCASALPPPASIDSMVAQHDSSPRDGAKSGQGAGASGRRSAKELLAQADAAWVKRAELAEAKRAGQLYLQAAQADPKEAAAFAGAVSAQAFQLGRETDADARKQLAASAVAIGQRCEEGSPGAAACDFSLGAALGLEARERTATARDALPHMVELLQRAEKSDPAYAHAGPARLLAILYLRAPGWPVGPGDTEAGLSEAQAAAKLAPDYAPNQLALAEALKKNGKPDEAKEAYRRALKLAAGTSGDPDAAGWANDARDGLH